MSKKLGQHPAFPVSSKVVELELSGNITYVKHKGVSKRFYAACFAMQGMLANNNPDMVSTETERLISAAYQFADELLKQE